MKKIFVNLKRFDVPRALGGVCPLDDPCSWIQQIMRDSVRLGLDCLPGVDVTYLLPESLIIPATHELRFDLLKHRGTLSIGCQSVYREDVVSGGNFGAFTTNLPAAAAKSMGCTWSIIGHSEERKDKAGIIGAFAPNWDKDNDEGTRRKGNAAVGSLLNCQVLRALEQGISVLFCVGESADERGGGSFEDQKPRVEAVLREQLVLGLSGIEKYAGQRGIVVAYEPVWAIGPGKIPPDRDYIAYASGLIKRLCLDLFGRELPVVYGGGLKHENARAVAGVETVDGGLVALTRFSGDIGFYIDELRAIIDEYIAGGA